MRHRVIVWGTGFVGKLVVAELLDHPAFELVAVLAHDPRKEGLDAGTLVGAPPRGLAVTTDVERALATDADAVAYFGPTALYLHDNLRNLSRALRAGKDVVSTSMTPLVWPEACPEAMRAPLVEACLAGGTSCFTTGIDPGFANDLFPLTLLGVCARADRVRVQEILDYASYPGDVSPMGFGLALDERCLLEEPELLVMAWGHTLFTIAAAMGVAYERVDTVWEKWPAEREVAYAHGVVARGRCAAVRFEIRGWLGGEPRVVLEHVNRLGPAAAPEWPRPSGVDSDAYRVIIDGSPSIVQETTFRGGPRQDANVGGCLATGMRAINAIPAVCAAPPGLLSVLDLPLVAGPGALRDGGRRR